MADTLYGSVPCPQLMGYVKNDGRLCGESATVYLTDDGDYRAECSAGHIHNFDARYEPNVTQIE